MKDIGILTTFDGSRMQDPNYRHMGCCGVGFLLKKDLHYFNCPYCGKEYTVESKEKPNTVKPRKRVT